MVYFNPMTTLEEHRRKINEHLTEINDAIEEGIEKKPITIGFHCSACSLELLELYLHKTKSLST
jgi:CRISPR/Cas system-associated exonuclease Cas4 (RecB family)